MIKPFIRLSKKQKKEISLIIKTFRNSHMKITPHEKTRRNRTRLEKYNLLIGDYQDLAYKLSELYNIKICPYCNENYTYTLIVKNEQGLPRNICRPDFDHFYCKSSDMHKALNLYNLVPSCQLCNSRIKGKKTNDRNLHYHPFFDNLFEDFTFHIDPKGSNIWENFDIKIIVNPQIKNRISFKKYSKNDDFTRADNTIKFFYLKERANFHKTEIVHILKTAEYNSLNRIKNIQNIIGARNLISLIFPYYKCDIRSMSLGKLKSDVTTYVMRKIGLI